MLVIINNEQYRQEQNYHYACLNSNYSDSKKGATRTGENYISHVPTLNGTSSYEFLIPLDDTEVQS